MRRSFAQVLKEGHFDLKKEYTKLYSLFYGSDERDRNSLYDFISNSFIEYSFRGTCLSLEEFNETYSFSFEDEPQNFDVDYFVNFCEYVFNLSIPLGERFFFLSFDKRTFISHIYMLIERIGYTQAHEDGYTIFVPKDNVAISVAESDIIPENISYKVIEYNHHSMKGDLVRKRATLLIFANLLEPRRKEIDKIDKSLTNDLFFAFNNLNIRHNNIDPAYPAKYKEATAEMPGDELERWYDEVYQMSLLAFMLLENIPRKTAFDELKAKLES